MNWLIGILALIGHIGSWCVVFNRIHATAWPRWTRKLSERLIALAVFAPLIGLVIWWGTSGGAAITDSIERWLALRIVLWACAILGAVFAAHWLWHRLTSRLPDSVLSSQIEWLDVGRSLSQSSSPASGRRELLHGAMAQLLGRVPGNEVLKLTRQRMTFSLNIPPQLDGFKICQLSDLHFTGHLGIEYFQAIVAQANSFKPDLVVITGDLVDERKCLDWLDSTVGELRATLGVVYVLGNHDLRIKDEPELRSRLSHLGLIAAAGAWHPMKYNGAVIQITGNERPWFKPAVAQDHAATAEPTCDLKILLSHSPDQIEWARQFEFDLMFAGHTHGGQIAIPLIGPLVAPSKYGTKYASGTFQVGKTLMHVSRGISGDEPIRIGSPPELGLFTLRAKQPLGD